MLAQLLTLAILSAPTLGKERPIINANTNITVALFSDANPPSCNKDDTAPPDISKALVLTTRTIPLSFTCFNTSNIFSQSNTTGTTNGTMPWSSGTKEDLADHIDWEIRGLKNFDSGANYSHVWYEQYGGDGRVEEGKFGRWVLWFYAFEDCQPLGTPGYDFEDDEPKPYEDNPWFETSCQTKQGGQCRTVPKSVKSFALNRVDVDADTHRECTTWAVLGDAARARGMWDMGLVGTVVVGATVLLLL